MNNEEYQDNLNHEELNHENEKNHGNEKEAHSEDHKNKEHEGSFKRVAMATFGAISNAVEKVAEVIGEATSPENLDKYAKKGEESFKNVKEAGGQVVKKVKEYSSQTVDKVKGAVPDEDLADYKDITSTKQALREELQALKKTAEQAETRINFTNTKEETEEFKDQVAKDLKQHEAMIEALIKHMKIIHEDEEKEREEAKKEHEKEEKEREKEENNEEKLSETAHVDKPTEDDIPYESPGYPKDVHARTEHAPADGDKASRIAPDKDNNTTVLETDARNDHLDQTVPPPMG